MVSRINNKILKYESKWQYLANKYEDLSILELKEYVRLDRELDNYPSNTYLRLPTIVGNTFVSMEEYPRTRYGLDANTTWPRLWLLLPETVKFDVILAKNTIDNLVQFTAWWIFFSIWSIWAWWALPVAILGGIITYSNLINATYSYADLMRATFDTYRFVLYDALKFPLPESDEDEYRYGEALTQYLKRGISVTNIKDVVLC